MKDLLHNFTLVREMVVLLLFLPFLAFSQNIPDNQFNTKGDTIGNLLPISFDSHGSTLYGYFSKAQGEETHPTMILLHGSPGGNGDVLGLAQAAPRAGWNAMVFTYRGFYNSEGTCSLKNSLEDVFSALNFIKSDEIVSKYAINVDHIALAGYSYGGDIALTAAAGDSSIKYAISIAAADISEIARRAKQNDEFRAMFVETMNNRISGGNITGPGGKEALKELLDIGGKYDLVKHASQLKGKSLLIIGGWNDQSSTIEGHILPLIRALDSNNAKGVTKVLLDTDHAFSGKRAELTEHIVSWLKENHPQKESLTLDIQEELWKSEAEYMHHYTKKNIKNLTKIWDEDFIGWPEWSEIPVNVDRAKLALSGPSKDRIIAHRIQPQNIQIEGNMAIVYYLIELDLKNSEQEKSTVTYRIIHTWINEDGNWHILGGMSSNN